MWERFWKWADRKAGVDEYRRVYALGIIRQGMRNLGHPIDDVSDEDLEESVGRFAEVARSTESPAPPAPAAPPSPGSAQSD